MGLIEGTVMVDDPVEWHCVCGAGDDAEWHSLFCVASNTPDEYWYGQHPVRECDHENDECHDIEHQRRTPTA